MDGIDTEINEALVRSLLREQHPDLAGLDLREVDGGWDNQMWRLGDDLAGDDAAIQRARGWAVARAVGLIAIGENGEKGLPGGKPTWLPAGWAALRRALA